ncbi:MAG: hypothetical protein H7070_06905 [Saprospiraceae bacterium]|nr:hypothetical protein [Pyrinomonadaceae bacterium]
MNRLTISFLFFAFSFVFMIGAVPAQVENKQVEPSYEAVLHLIVGSSDASLKDGLPQNLSNISRQIKTNFAFSNYRLANTFVGRIANTGSFEYKSLSDMFGQESSDSRTFLEWTLGGLRAVPDASGQTTFQAQTFRFGARVPLKTGQTKNSEGQIIDLINYEQVGLSMNRTSFGENKPTLIGTLSLPKTSGTLFLVLTMKTVDN